MVHLNCKLPVTSWQMWGLQVVGVRVWRHCSNAYAFFLIANCVYGCLRLWHLFSFGVNWRWIILQGLLIIWEKKNLMGVEIWKCEALDPIQKNSKMREAASSDLNGLVSGGETSWEAPSSEPQSRDFPSWGLKASCSCICRYGC